MKCDQSYCIILSWNIVLLYPFRSQHPDLVCMWLMWWEVPGRQLPRPACAHSHCPGPGHVSGRFRLLSAICRWRDMANHRAGHPGRRALVPDTGGGRWGRRRNSSPARISKWGGRGGDQYTGRDRGRGWKSEVWKPSSVKSFWPKSIQRMEQSVLFLTYYNKTRSAR